jgi:predicted translin family RNA/ssDNA-binding protein
MQGTKAMKTELQRLGRDIASHSEVIEYLKQATMDEIAEAVLLASAAHPEADRRRLEAFSAFLRGGR